MYIFAAVCGRIKAPAASGYGSWNDFGRQLDFSFWFSSDSDPLLLCFSERCWIIRMRSAKRTAISMISLGSIFSP